MSFLLLLNETSELTPASGFLERLFDISFLDYVLLQWILNPIMFLIITLFIYLIACVLQYSNLWGNVVKFTIVSSLRVLH